MISLADPYVFENTSSNLLVFESKSQTWTHLSLVPVAIRVFVVDDASTAMQRTSPPRARRLDRIGSKRF